MLPLPVPDVGYQSPTPYYLGRITPRWRGEVLVFLSELYLDPEAHPTYDEDLWHYVRQSEEAARSDVEFLGSEAGPADRIPLPGWTTPENVALLRNMGCIVAEGEEEATLAEGFSPAQAVSWQIRRKPRSVPVNNVLLEVFGISQDSATAEVFLEFVRVRRTVFHLPGTVTEEQRAALVAVGCTIERVSHPRVSVASDSRDDEEELEEREGPLYLLGVPGDAVLDTAEELGALGVLESEGFFLARALSDGVLRSVALPRGVPRHAEAKLRSLGCAVTREYPGLSLEAVSSHGPVPPLVLTSIPPSSHSTVTSYLKARFPEDNFDTARWSTTGLTVRLLDLSPGDVTRLVCLGCTLVPEPINPIAYFLTGVPNNTHNPSLRIRLAVALERAFREPGTRSNSDTLNPQFQILNDITHGRLEEVQLPIWTSLPMVKFLQELGFTVESSVGDSRGVVRSPTLWDFLAED